MNKKDEDQEYGKLIEALTIERTFEEAKTPPFGGYNGGHTKWLGYTWLIGGPPDIVFRNKEGKYHRLYGPAYISEKYGVEIWFSEGKYHRVGGPAIRHKNNLLYYQDGLLHRLDGPAIIDGGGPKQYWIEGRKYSIKEYKKEIARRKRKGRL